MHKYEILYILDSKLDDAKKDKEIEKFSSIIEKQGGKVESVVKTAPWGLKKFAYPIDYKKDGFYVLKTFIAKPTTIAELEHRMKLADSVMRFKTAIVLKNYNLD